MDVDVVLQWPISKVNEHMAYLELVRKANDTDDG